MVRLSYFIRRPPGLSLESFQQHWLDIHAPLVAKHAAALGVRRYVQAHVLPDDPVGEMLRQMYGAGGEPYDGVAELWWKSQRDLTQALEAPEAQRAAGELLEDERCFIDFSRSALRFGVDIPQINPPGEIVAREGTMLLKGYYVGPVVPDLPEEKAKFHWFTCHGPLARQYEQFLPYRRYIQVHAINEPLGEALRAARGGMEERSAIGHAEVWFDRRDLASAAGPEAEQAFRLLVEDISSFVDTSQAAMFVAKEHVIVDRPIFTAPLPSPFD